MVETAEQLRPRNIGDAEQHSVRVAGVNVDYLRKGSGDPLLVLHHDIGNPGWLPFYDRLAERFTVYVPSHPGFDSSERPTWMRDVREMAALYSWFLRELKLDSPVLVGLGFGGWIAAELAVTGHGRFRAMVLVSSMGLQPREGEIFDQFLVNSEEYITRGFVDLGPYHQTFGEPPDVSQLVVWEVNREMTTRIAWKPYMFHRALEHLLPGVDLPTLVVCGEQDRIVPPDVSRHYAELIPGARLETMPDCGHFPEIERPDALAEKILNFLA